MLLALDSHKIIFARLIRCRSFYRVLCLVRIAMGYVDYKHFQLGCAKIIFITFFFFICLGMSDVSVECAGGTHGGGNFNILSSEKFKTSNLCKPLFTVIMTHSKIKLFCVGHAISF
jgi:hypothetical protein